jgi:hypothetical protein
MMRNLLWVIATPALFICLPIILMVMTVGLMLVSIWWVTETFTRWLVRKFKVAMEYADW